MITRVVFAGLLGALAIAHSRGAQAVDCRKATLERAAYIVCQVDVAKEHLRLHYADPRGHRLESFEALRESLAES